MSAWWLQSFVYAKEYAIIIRGVSVEQLIKGLFLGRYFRLGYYHLMFIWLAIPLSTFYLFFKTIVPLIRRKALTDSQLKLFLAAVLSIMSWMQYYPMTDPVHCFWAASPIMGFFVYVLINVFVPKDKKLSVLFMRLFITLLVFTLILRVELSLSRFKNTANYSRTFPFLKYIRLTAFDDITLSSFHSKLVSQMGEKDTYITIADDFSVSLMDPRFHQIDPLHGIWGFFTEKLHPEYYPNVNSYISQEHPVIVTRTLPFVSNYCSVKGVNYTHLFMGIHIPSSRIFDAQLSENEITLYPKKDTVITGISGLKTPIHHFSIFDLKKIDMSPLQDEEISFPVTLYKDTALTIPLKNPAPHIVIHFKDPDIETCTVPVNNKGFYP